MHILYDINKGLVATTGTEGQSILARAEDTEKIKEFKTIEDPCSKYVQMSKKKNTKRNQVKSL